MPVCVWVCLPPDPNLATRHFSRGPNILHSPRPAATRSNTWRRARDSCFCTLDRSPRPDQSRRQCYNILEHSPVDGEMLSLITSGAEVTATLRLPSSSTPLNHSPRYAKPSNSPGQNSEARLECGSYFVIFCFSPPSLLLRPSYVLCHPRKQVFLPRSCAHSITNHGS